MQVQTQTLAAELTQQGATPVAAPTEDGRACQKASGRAERPAGKSTSASAAPQDRPGASDNAPARGADGRRGKKKDFARIMGEVAQNQAQQETPPTAESTSVGTAAGTVLPEAGEAQSPQKLASATVDADVPAEVTPAEAVITEAVAAPVDVAAQAATEGGEETQAREGQVAAVQQSDSTTVSAQAPALGVAAEQAGSATAEQAETQATPAAAAGSVPTAPASPQKIPADSPARDVAAEPSALKTETPTQPTGSDEIPASETARQRANEHSAVARQAGRQVEPDVQPVAGEQVAAGKSAGKTESAAPQQQPAADAAQPPQAAAVQADSPASRTVETAQVAARPDPADVPETSAPAHQVLRSLADRQPVDGQTITIRLNPPELGRVNVSIQAEGRELKAVFEADNPRTLGELRREAAGLVGSLSQNGVQVRRVEFVVTDQANNQNASTTQNWQSQQQQAWSQDSQAARQGSQFTETLEDDAPAPAAGAWRGETILAEGQLSVWA